MLQPDIIRLFFCMAWGNRVVYNQVLKLFIFRKGLTMKNLLILCLTVFLTVGLCGIAAVAAQGDNADKGKDKAGDVKAPKERAEKAREAKQDDPNKAAKEKKEASAVKEGKGGKDAKKEEMKKEGHKEKGKSEVKSEAKKDQEGVAKGKEHAQRSAATEKQLAHEQEKHKSRLARLERIKELAQKDGDTKAIERVDKLIADENDRFTKKTAALEGKAAETKDKAEKAAKPAATTEEKKK
jgi:hypothetical protein